MMFLNHSFAILSLVVVASTVSAFTRTTHFGRSAGWTTIPSSSSLKMATWSDARAVREYQEFLASGKQEIEKMDDGPSVIVAPHPTSEHGSSELADALVLMGMGDDVVVTPDQELPDGLGERSSYPVYIILPPHELNDFLLNMPDSFKNRREDLVFFSGGLKYGNIEGVLKDRGYARDAQTQVLISGMDVRPMGVVDVSIKIGIATNGEDKWAGECAACGKWLGAIEKRLEANNIRCKTGFYREWKRDMWERTLYDSVFNLVGAIRSEPTTLADVAMYYEEEVSDMLWEMSGYLRGSRALTMTYGFEERLLELAEARGDETPCTVVDHMYPYLFEPFGYCKKFTEYVTYAQAECGLFPTAVIERPSQTIMDRPPLIRPGNLRADGVI
jgi:hypothetical protein